MHRVCKFATILAGVLTVKGLGKLLSPLTGPCCGARVPVFFCGRGVRAVFAERWRAAGHQARIGGVCAIRLIFAGLISGPGLLVGQALPDAGQVMREVERSEAIQAERPELAKQKGAEAEVEPEEETGEAKVWIETVAFSGHSVLSDAELEAIVAGEMGKAMGFRQMQALTRRVSAAYQEAGYLARVVLPEQDLADGVLRMAVEEMMFGGVVVPEGTDAPVRSGLIEKMGSVGQAEGRLLRYDALKRSASLINNLPGLRSELILERGDEPLAMRVVVPVVEDRPFEGILSLDNFGSESTGELRALGRVVWANPLRMGDAMSAVSLVSEGNRYLGADYSVPLGVGGWRVGAHASALDYELVGAFEYLEASGHSVVAGTHASYPLRLEASESLLFSARLEVRSYYNEVGGVETSDKLLTVAEGGLNWIRSDTWMGGGRTLVSGRVRFGDVDLSGNASNERQDAQDAETAGTFFKVEGSFTRFQVLPYGLDLQVSVRGQHGFASLDSSETYSLGGPGGVRAYPTLEANVDSALLGSVELGRALGDTVRAALFYDAASGYLQSTLRRGSDSSFLHGVGAALRARWAGPFSGEVSVARRIGDNPNADPDTGKDQDGTLREWRVWTSLSIQF